MISLFTPNGAGHLVSSSGAPFDLLTLTREVGATIVSMFSEPLNAFMLTLVTPSGITIL